MITSQIIEMTMQDLDRCGSITLPMMDAGYPGREFKYLLSPGINDATNNVDC
jgi:hypothetical protein